MYSYETLFLLRAELPEAQTRETIDRSKRLIEGMGGTMSQVDEWGVRELAYPVKKQPRAFYVLFEYGATPDTVRELERTLKIADEVLRFVTVRRDLAKEERARRARRPSAARPPREVELEGDLMSDEGEV